jgi:thymidylate synthase
MSDFGFSMEFDLQNSFPLLTTKRVFMRGVFEELLFFLRGDTDTKILEKKGVNIWKGNTSREFLDSVGLTDFKEGDIGTLYSIAFNHFNCDYQGMNKDYTGQGINQIQYCLNLIKNDPTSRRIIMTSYNPSKVHLAPLYPCHSICVQWYVNDDVLNCTMYARSQDIVCGTPFNIASTCLLCHVFCSVVNSDPNYKGKQLKPGKVKLDLGDCHIYEEHADAVLTQLSRLPYLLPQLVVNRKTTDFKNFVWEDIELKNYNCHSAIKVNMIA